MQPGTTKSVGGRSRARDRHARSSCKHLWLATSHGHRHPERIFQIHPRSQCACGNALCGNAVQPADADSLTADQQTQRQEYIDLALACLRESIAAGYSNFDHMQQDPDLAVLRELPEFEALLPTPMEPDSDQE